MVRAKIWNQNLKSKMSGTGVSWLHSNASLTRAPACSHRTAEFSSWSTPRRLSTTQSKHAGASLTFQHHSRSSLQGWSHFGLREDAQVEAAHQRLQQKNFPHRHPYWCCKHSFLHLRVLFTNMIDLRRILTIPGCLWLPSRWKECDSESQKRGRAVQR